MALNKVMLIGNVGKKPEIRYLENQGGASPAPKVATFPLATSERFRDRNGEVRESTEWHNIVAWRQLADLAEKFMDKGSQIYVEGRLRSRSWDGQDGQKRFITEIVADSIQLLGKRSDNPGAEGYQASAPAQPAQAAAPAQFAPQAPKPVAASPAPAAPSVSAEEDDSDDLPF